MRRPEALALILIGCLSRPLRLAGPAAKIERMVDVGGRMLDCCFYGKGSPRSCWSAALRLPKPIGTP